VLCPLLWVTLLGQGVGLGDPQRSLPTLTMLGFCDSVNSEGKPSTGVGVGARTALPGGPGRHRHVRGPGWGLRPPVTAPPSTPRRPKANCNTSNATDTHRVRRGCEGAEAKPSCAPGTELREQTTTDFLVLMNPSRRRNRPVLMRSLDFQLLCKFLLF